MVKGRYAAFFWGGVVLALAGGLVPWLSLFMEQDVLIGINAALATLIGLLLYEHAYVQAGQSVPLA
jgi:hypothetical protein